jgi:putative nucleotidyltransferase with HDIG domain
LRPQTTIEELRDAPVEIRVDALLALLARMGGADYIGESLSQLDHALQCAALARRTGDSELILAALLHDLGHAMDGEQLRGPNGEALGVADHQTVGAEALRALGFGERVAGLVARHVDAKRYLVLRSGYLDKLSPASRHTLELQGGPMSDEELQEFEADPLHEPALRLRAYDEAAKDPEAQVPSLDAYRSMMIEDLWRREATEVLTSLDAGLSHDQVARFERDHVLVLPALFRGRPLTLLRNWTDDLAARPETAGKWMKYYESTRSNERQLCRVEDFLPYHPGFDQLLRGEAMMALLEPLMGEPAVLFKEKINFKLPGGAGFRAHQDAPAFAAFGQRYHITVLLTIDPSNRANGGLEMSDPVEVGEILDQEPDGTLARGLEAELPWRPLDLPEGSLVLFDSYIPHRSPDNRSDRSRRSLYVTYNRRSDGERRNDYYTDKRRRFPPEIEREPGVDYAALGGPYNLGNPIR